MGKLTIEYMPLESLQRALRNPKDHDLGELHQSLDRFDFVSPLIVNETTGRLVVGHGRLDALQQMKASGKQPPGRVVKKGDSWLVPVIRGVEFKDDSEAEAYLLADNRLTELGGWHEEQLAQVLSDLAAGGEGALAGVGWDAEDVDKMLSEYGVERTGLTDDDAVPDVPEEPVSKLGDLYILGEHRLLCGDATKEEDVERLMDGEKADMVFTDPPYNIDYGVSKNPRHKIRTLKGDKQLPEEWELFCKNIFQIFKAWNIGDIYMWGASSPEGMRMRLWLVESGCHWSATIVWKKQQLVLSPAKYQRMYEPCFYGWFNRSSFRADRKQTEVWEIDRPLNSKLHPTMKPVELCQKGIKNSSKKGQIVLDIFGGSGSTLIACEKTNRKCFMMEIDPLYCDVIVKRWEDYTGQKARLV